MAKYEDYFENARIEAACSHENLVLRRITPEELYQLCKITRPSLLHGTWLGKFFDAYDDYYAGKE